ncbi:MAG: hypothetical protein PHI19_00005 [Clostridia bacterium]|jgi:hypothetical protein|nr:hypothetical protein [Clostridia bacterium]
MKLTTAVQVLKKELAELAAVADKEKVLAIMIFDEMAEYDVSMINKISQRSRLILGLGYSEFFADTTSDNELCAASEKRDILLKHLGVDATRLNEEMRSTYGKRGYGLAERDLDC